jgi:polysaccharide deacetylase 2 family uncharacterized protein YibQ
VAIFGVAAKAALSRQLCTTLCATARQNSAAILGGHTSAETMAALANQLAGLICTFHDNNPY